MYCENQYYSEIYKNKHLTDKATEHLSMDYRCPVRDSNSSPPHYESGELPLSQPAR
jgi:hypothetical protein